MIDLTSFLERRLARYITDIFPMLDKPRSEKNSWLLSSGTRHRGFRMLYPYRIIIADSRSIGGLLLQVNINAVYPTATISVVGTGPEVLQTYERTGADLLILNQNLAIIDSLELTRLLRAKGVTIPIILLANISQIEGLAKKAGVTLFLSGSEIIVQLIRELPKLLQPNPQNK